MSEVVIAALISGVIAAAASITVAVIQHRKSVALIEYRLQQLEKKVDKHNNFAERLPVIEEKLKDHDRRLSEVEHETA